MNLESPVLMPATFDYLTRYFVVRSFGFGDVMGLAIADGALVAFSFVLMHFLLRSWFRRRRIQTPHFEVNALCRELMLSASTLMLGGTIGALTAYGALRGWITIDFRRSVLPLVPLQVALYLATFDLYLYVVHRVLHLRPLYQAIHRLHHLSVIPNPLTAFSIHPVEAILNGIFLPLFLSNISIHIYALIVVSIHTQVNTVLLHCGHEVFPRWWYAVHGSRWYATPLFHDLHHQRVTCNYGVLTTIWDRVFGTITPHFGREFEQFEERLGAAI